MLGVTVTGAVMPFASRRTPTSLKNPLLLVSLEFGVDVVFSATLVLLGSTISTRFELVLTTGFETKANKPVAAVICIGSLSGTLATLLHATRPNAGVCNPVGVNWLGELPRITVLLGQVLLAPVDELIDVVT